MADVNISMMLADQGNSVKNKTNDVKSLNSELTKTQKLAKGVAVGGEAGTGKATSQQMMDYGRSRATVGTGAEARDFAKQSEGLSGLVRLYAIYAANIYAAGAAFQALSAAMDTTTMIKSMDQLGASTGVAMGSLAKRFAEASGGAISFKEAAQAASKAITSGLSTKQFQDVGAVALKASQALGISFTDAVSRLTRGITKLEPELLDELGIYTKIGPATEEYAKKIGKTADQLTQYERLQAFANATLDEGFKKFNAINQQANPYDKLLASLKNLSQTILEVVNKALGPLINALSQSPTALLGILGLLGLNLVKQALPALGQYREELQKTAEVAEKVAAKKAIESKAARLSAFGGALQKADDVAAEAEDRASRTWENLEKAIKKSSGKVAESAKPALAKLLSKDNLFDVTKQDLKILDDLGSKNTKIAATYRQLAEEIRQAQRAAKDFAVAAQAKAAAEAKPLPFFSMAGFNERIAKGAASKAERSRIISRAVEESSVGGITSSFAQLAKETKASQNMGLFGKTATIVGGSVGILTNGLVRLASSLGTAGMVIGVLTGTFAALDGWLSKTADQTANFNESIGQSEEAVKTYNSVVSYLLTQDPSKRFSTDAVTAYSNAIANLVDSTTDLTNKFDILLKATKNSAWDTITSGIADFFGMGMKSKFSSQITATLQSLVDSIDDLDSRAAAVKLITDTLGGDWSKAIYDGGEKAVQALRKLNPELEKLKSKIGNAAQASKAFDDALKSATDKQKQLSDSLKEKSPILDYADDLLKFGVEFNNVVKGDISTAISRLNALLSSQTNMGIFSPEARKQLMGIKDEVDRLNTANGAVTNAIKEQENQVSSLEAEYQALRDAIVSAGSVEYVGPSEQDIQAALQPQIDKLEQARKALDDLRKAQGSIRASIGQALSTPEIGSAISEVFIKATTSIVQALDLAFKKGSLELSKAALPGLQGAIGSASLEGRLNERSINIQRQQLIQLENIARLNESILAATLTGNALKAPGAYAQGRGASAQNVEFVKLTELFQSMVDSSGGKGIKQFSDALLKFQKTYKGSISTEQGQAIGQMVGSLRTKTGTAATMAGLDSQSAINKLQTQQKIESEIAENKIKGYDLEKGMITLQQQKLAAIEQQNGALSEQQITQARQYADKQAELDLDKTRAEINKDRKNFESSLAILSKDMTQSEKDRLVASQEALFTAREKLAKGQEQQKLNDNELKAKQQLNNLLFEEAAQIEKIKLLRQEIANIVQNNELTAMQLELDYMTQLGTYSRDELARAKERMDNKKIELTLNNSLQQSQNKLNSEASRIGKEIGKLDLNTQSGQKRRDELLQELSLLNEKFAVEKAGYETIYNLEKRNLDLLNKYNDRQKSYGEIFEKTFEGMADAIVEFAKTGKFEFKDLINSMLAELLRYELKMQMMAMYQAFRPGLMNFVGSFFGAPAAPGTALPPLGVGEAQGGVYDTGIRQKFAKGGMFTNSIVDSPTLFKFAKGTGLMGEAGPEAIMPLKRDAQGNLGVRGGNSSNVEVVVNNYGTEKASANEVVDSRGNRRIEVTIGEMAAGEIARSGSSQQRAMRGTFGLSPQLIRR